MWGNENTGGNLKTDATNIEVRRAFIDWVLPETSLKLRIGLQGVALPAAVAGSPILDEDVAGITAAWEINDMVSMSFGWVRLADGHESVSDTYTSGRGNGSDDADMFFIAVPVKGEGWDVTPWIANAHLGKESMPNADRDAMRHYLGSVDAVFWAGVALNINIFDPLSLKFDAMVGSTFGDNSEEETTGYYIAFAADYKLDMVTPGFFA